MTQATLAYSVQSGEVEGYESWTLGSRDADLSATFVPSAGMVGCSLRHAGDELLDLQGGIGEYVRNGAQMGIPLLHPWANRLAGFEYQGEGSAVRLDPESLLLNFDENGLPIHGVLAGSPHWEVRRAAANAKGATLGAELDFGTHDDLLAAFPFPHLLRIDVRLEGTALTIRTTIVARDDVEVPVSFGFHPYLRLPGAPREQWELTLPVRRRLLLDERMIPTGRSEPVRFRKREPLGDRSFDDGFTELSEPPSFAAAAAGRELVVTFLEGYPFAQVYSPSGAEFICFEPMTAPTNALLESGAALRRVEPSRSFSAEFEISVTGG